LKVQADQLTSHLKNELAPCYLVSGDEPLLVDEALDAIRAAARADGFTSRDVFVATTGFDWSQLAASGANLSLFAEKRIVELRLPTGKPGRAGGQAIVDFLDQLGPELMLVVITPRLDRKTASTKWVKAVEARAVHVPVWPVDIRRLPRWIEQRMRRAGLEPSRNVTSMLAERVEGNLLAASQEVEKLRLLLGEGPVSVEDVGKAVADSSRYDVFKLADAALAGDGKRAIRILNGLEDEGVEPVIVIWSLTRELRVLARIAAEVGRRGDLGAAMSKARVWRNRQALVRGAVGRHSAADVLRLLKATGRADACAKGQAPGDPWQAAADIVLELSLAGRRAA